MSVPSSLSEVVREGLAWQLMQAMTDAVFLFDPASLQILEVNDAATQLTMRARDQYLGEQLTDVFSELPPNCICLTALRM